jgi:hypothetical protein
MTSLMPGTTVRLQKPLRPGEPAVTGSMPRSVLARPGFKCRSNTVFTRPPHGRPPCRGGIRGKGFPTTSPIFFPVYLILFRSYY